MEEQRRDPKAANPGRLGAVSHSASQEMLDPAQELEGCPVSH